MGAGITVNRVILGVQAKRLGMMQVTWNTVKILYMRALLSHQRLLRGAMNSLVSRLANSSKRKWVRKIWLVRVVHRSKADFKYITILTVKVIRRLLILQLLFYNNWFHWLQQINKFRCFLKSLRISKYLILWVLWSLLSNRQRYQMLLFENKVVHLMVV